MADKPIITAGTDKPKPPKKLSGRLASFFRVAFTTNIKGYGVPIAVTILLALLPIYLTHQQNSIIERQEEASELQTLAETSNLSRSLFDDITGVVSLIARLNAASSLYKDMKDTTVSVISRTNAPKQFKFDERAVARGYSLDLCGPNFTAQLRPGPPEWGTKQCQATDMYALLHKLRSYDFESDPYGKTLVAWIYYLDRFSELEKYRLLGTTGFNINGDPKEDSVSNIIEQARVVCSIEPGRATHASNLAANMTVIESSAQHLIEVFQFNPADVEDQSGEIKQQLANEFRDAEVRFKTSTSNFLRLSNAPQEDLSHLTVIEGAVTDGMNSLSDDISFFLDACNKVRDSKVKLQKRIEAWKPLDTPAR